MARAPITPPIVTLGRALAWSPLPLTVRDARQPARELRARLPSAPRPMPSRPPGAVVGSVERVTVRYGGLVALREVSLQVRAGEIVALMGRNGAGKSTLLAALAGVVAPTSGTARVGGEDPRALRGRALTRHVGLVPQQPGDLLYADTTAEECALADEEAGATPGTAAALLRRVAGVIDPALHPRDLSEGQRLALALAVVMASAPPLLLDEPTRGLDYPAKARLGAALRELAASGHGIVLATHDVELAAEVSARTVVLADGDVVADGPSRDVVTQSPIFAPQVAKVLAPLPYLTVDDVLRTLDVA
jgi:energy-coupling factor transport system ATP-binding protein